MAGQVTAAFSGPKNIAHWDEFKKPLKLYTAFFYHDKQTIN